VARAWSEVAPVAMASSTEASPSAASSNTGRDLRPQGRVGQAGILEGGQGLAALRHRGRSGVAGPAGVEEQRPDPLPGTAGQMPDHRQRDGGAIGVTPVQRHWHVRALQPRSTCGPIDRRLPGSGRARRSSRRTGVDGDGRNDRQHHRGDQHHEQTAVRAAVRTPPVGVLKGVVTPLRRS
jgi:hypothetical protein